MGQTPILFVTSHDAGRNARVTLWPDRIERVRDRKRTSMSRARQDTEVTPVKSISSVQATKDGVRFTKVTVFASGNNIEFRLSHDEAQRFKDALMQLVLGHTPTTAPPPASWQADPMGRHELRYWNGSKWTDHVSDDGQQSQDPVNPPAAEPATAAAAPDVAEQIRKLATLRDEGLLSSEEFEAKKAELLARL